LDTNAQTQTIHGNDFNWNVIAALKGSYEGYIVVGMAAAMTMLFASFINRQTDAREMACLLATCVRDKPERRS
jgi:hypothetical protein